MCSVARRSVCSSGFMRIRQLHLVPSENVHFIYTELAGHARLRVEFCRRNRLAHQRCRAQTAALGRWLSGDAGQSRDVGGSRVTLKRAERAGRAWCLYL